MFASLFKRAEASVDSALGELGNRLLIGIPFIVAIGFAAASFSSFANRTYGPEVGNLIVAGGFVMLGFIVALIVKLRKRPGPLPELHEEAVAEEPPSAGPSFLEDEKVMSIVSAAAPIVLPAMLRTATKNWPLILAAAAGLYVFSRSESAGGTTQPAPPQV